MNKTSLICASVAALALATGGALAQSEDMSPGGGDSAGPSMEMAPPSGGGAGAPRMEPGLEGAGPGDAGRATTSDRNLRTGEPFDSGGASESRRGSRDAGAAGGRERDGSAETGASEGEAGRDRADRSERHGKRGRDAGNDDRDARSRGSEGASDGEADRRDRAGREDRMDRRGNRAGRDRDKGGDARDRDADAAEGVSEGAEGRDARPSGSLTKLSGEKRTEVQSAFRSHRSEAVVGDIDIHVGVGVTVPRTVSLYAVPQDVVVIVPDYERYKYFIYEDKVIVVDPDTLVIVDILVLA